MEESFQSSAALEASMPDRKGKHFIKMPIAYVKAGFALSVGSNPQLALYWQVSNHCLGYIFITFSKFALKAKACHIDTCLLV
jgi:hypothetical protein